MSSLRKIISEGLTAPGNAPDLTLAVNGSVVTATVTAIPAAGRSVIAYTVEQSADGVSGWTPLATPDPVAPSEVPGRSATSANKVVDPALTPNGTTIFATLQSAFDTLNPGDVLDIAPGTYSGRVTITRSGTAGNRITVRAQNPASPPVIDGNYTAPAGWDGSTGSACLLAVQAEYITLDGINVTRSSRFGILCGDCTNNGFFASAPNTFYRGITLIRCSVVGANNNALRTINTDGCEIYGSTFLDSERSAYQANGFLSGWGAGVTLMGKNVTFIENVIGQASGEGLHLGYHGAFGGGNGYAHIEATNVVIRANRIFDTWSAPMYVTNVDGGLIERNVVWHTADTRYWYGAVGGYPQYGIDVASESGNTGVAGFNGFIGARNLVIRNNIATGSRYVFRFVNENTQATNNVRVYNNTFTRVVAGSSGSDNSLTYNGESELSDIYYKNNLHHTANAAELSRLWLTPSGTWSRGTNLWSSTPPAALQGTGDIVTASPGVVNVSYAATGTYPAVSSFAEGNLKLTAGSPAVNAGEVLADVPTDFYGVTRYTGSGFIDIGAISLSKPLSVTYSYGGQSPGAKYFRAKFTDSSLSDSDYSLVKSVIV